MRKNYLVAISPELTTESDDDSRTPRALKVLDEGSIMFSVDHPFEDMKETRFG